MQPLPTLAWADPAYRESYPRLHGLGATMPRAYVRSKRGEDAVSAVACVKVETQVDRIDVLPPINDDDHDGLVLIVEDKLDTDEHSNRIESHRRTPRDKYPNRRIVPVYVKTGNVSQCNLPSLPEEECVRFLRPQLLDVLNRYPAMSDTTIDNFRAHLQQSEEETNGYLKWTRDAERSSQRAWEGFYQLPEKELADGAREIGWGLVDNPSGGFLGFWWWPDGDEPYLQIEPPTDLNRPGARLCFKVKVAAGTDVEEQKTLKWRWHERFLKADGAQVVKPDVMRRGQTMTLAWWKDEWMAFGEDSNLDVDGTVEN